MIGIGFGSAKPVDVEVSQGVVTDLKLRLQLFRFSDDLALLESRDRDLAITLSVDRVGNVSAQTGATAWPSPIVAPRYLEVVHSPPLVDWRAVKRAAYYNMQAWRDGRKILSVWPSHSRYRLRANWIFGGRRHLLTEGRVTIFVWAGFGPKWKARYGPLYGRTTFVVG